MLGRRCPRHVILSAAVLAVAYWLFADTVAYYWPARESPNRVRFSHFGTYQDYETWRAVIAAFEAENPAISVTQEYVSGWYGLYDTKVREQILADSLPDVVLMQIGPFLHTADHFADLGPHIESTGGDLSLSALDSNGVRAFTYDGRLRGLPVSGGNLLIYCNPDCFRQASEHHRREIALPHDDWTINEFRELSELLTFDWDGDGETDQFGFWQPRWVYYLPFIWSFGADVLDASDSQWMLTGPEAEAAFAFYQNMRFGRRISPHPWETAQIIQDVGFLTGKVGMCVNGPWLQPFLAETRLANRYHVAHFPKGPGGRVTRVTWDGLCMARGRSPARQASAWRFIRFACSKRGQDILAATQRALPASHESAEVFVQRDQGRNSRKFVEALRYSRLQPMTPHFQEMDRAINRHLRSLLAARDRIDARTLLDRLVEGNRSAVCNAEQFLRMLK